MPLRAEGMKKGRAFCGGVLSGVVEPIGAVLTILAAQLVVPALPYLLSFAAGAMLYVVVEELIPEMSQGDALQYRHGVLRRGLQHHDDAGRGARINNKKPHPPVRMDRRMWFFLSVSLTSIPTGFPSQRA